MSSNTHHPRAGGGNPEKPATGGAQNMAHLLRRRQEGKIPASAGGFVLGGHTSSRAASADLRSSRRGGGAPGFGFRRNVGQHPSLIERLRHTATLRGHSGEFSVAQPLLSVCLSVSMCICLSLSLHLSAWLCVSPPPLSPRVRFNSVCLSVSLCVQVCVCCNLPAFWSAWLPSDDFSCPPALPVSPSDSRPHMPTSTSSVSPPAGWGQKQMTQTEPDRGSP